MLNTKMRQIKYVLYIHKLSTINNLLCRLCAAGDDDVDIRIDDVTIIGTLNRRCVYFYYYSY